MPARDLLWRMATVILAVTTVVFYCQASGARGRLRQSERERAELERAPRPGRAAATAPADAVDPEPAPRTRGPSVRLGNAGDGGATINIGIPPALLAMAPAPGENLNDYRDRMIPVVQQLVEPQRQRVRDARARFEQAAALDAGQKAALDAAADQAAEAILDRVLQGALSGELRPGMQPMTAIAAARDLLDAVLAAEQRFKAALGADPSAAMAGSRFDFADYVLFATRWEQMLGLAD
jgi:hypothetical protein